ncbi:MAG: asparagine synthase (glutamine-hydrolyzing) [Sediminibacterium sp.]
MCGIIGAISSDKLIDRVELQRAADAIKHRGPDAEGIWFSDDGCIGLAHRRLSVIDLQASANQPMISEDKSAVIVFNGEIYNFLFLKQQLTTAGIQFKTNSDTEVLLAAYKCWGKACVEKLDGMFAFVILDLKRKELFLARDRAGEKPLYFINKGNHFLFASEVKALFAFSSFNKKINFTSLEYAMMFGYVPSGNSIFKDVNKLLPGEQATYHIESGKLHRQQYWRMEHCPQAKYQNEEEWVHECENLLEMSVKQQLYADVPVGILLSGGIDSSLITALASRSSSKLKTFTVTFPGEGKFDETKYARSIANHFSTQHHEIVSDDITPTTLPNLAAQFDEPMFDSSAIPAYYVTKAVRKHCTVALGGDGADEVFGGYKSNIQALRFSKYAGLLKLTGFKNLSKYLLHHLSEGYKGKYLLSYLSTDYQDGVPMMAIYFGSESISNLFGKESTSDVKSYQQRKSQIANNHDLLARCMLLDFEQYLPEDILIKMDRMSMLNSLEIRSPFLSNAILSFSASIPNELKADTHSSKILLRKLAKKILPKEFDLNRKQGFSIPLKKWLHETKWNSFFKEILLDHSCVLNKKFINQLFADHASGRSNNERLYALVMLELWRKEYEIAFD